MWEGVQTHVASGHAGRQVCSWWTKVDQWIVNKAFHLFRSSGPSTTSLHHENTFKTQGGHCWVSQQPISDLVALRWGSGTENSDSQGWVWFKPDLILYQKIDFILSIYYSKDVPLPFKLWPHGKTSCQMSFPREKRVLLKHLKVMSKCIASCTFV